MLPGHAGRGEQSGRPHRRLRHAPRRSRRRPDGGAGGAARAVAAASGGTAHGILLDPLLGIVPDVSLAVAEKFALKGKRVLVLLTDMTNFADSLKEIAITMEQIPSNRGYPGDLYSQLASRYEKAVDFEGSGSITILAVTTMPGDDVTHPVPDNTGYITGSAGDKIRLFGFPAAEAVFDPDRD